MSKRLDLTRWNRAGLTRFRYVDGNAVEYLELLRQRLVEQFADPKTGLCDWLNPPEKTPLNESEQEDETLIERQERLSLKQKRILETYHQDRRDWAWEIARTFARSCHILTEYANAYANEGYLGTATQWDHVRRLVEMLDYHPAPPASASTRLVFVAKGDSPGIVAKGFQIKNSPPTGGDKVIFETLEDLFIDPALNEMRPKGWNRSEDPAVPAAVNGSTQPPPAPEQFSPIANGPVINLQGVGETWARQLDTLPDDGEFKIKDFLDLDPEKPGIVLDPADPDFALDPEAPGAEIGAVRLREFKAKATQICNFELEAGWSDITNWLLPRIASASPEELAQITGKPLDKVRALQLRVELIGAYLDQTVYENSTLKDLLAPTSGSATGGEQGSVATSWRAKEKPKVEPGQVAMIFHKSENKAEAATIDRVEETSGDIHLLLNQVDYTWPEWPKSEVTLHVVPRWQRQCWLNGSNVIRTKEPHGLTVKSDSQEIGTFIGWKKGDVWQYAEITEADKKNLRLDFDGPLPEKDTNLYQLNPIAGSIAPKDTEVIALLGTEGEGGDLPNTAENPIVEDVPPEISKSPFDDIFEINDDAVDAIGGGGGGFLPPGGLPKIGSFLFPTPMLPMDLVKAAVELMLNLGVMQIPSSGEIVIKGLPFEGDLAGQPNMEVLAGHLFTMLDGMKAVDSDGNDVSPEEKLITWKPRPDGSLKTEAEIIADLTAVLSKAEGKPSALFQEIKEGIVRSGPLLAISKEATEKAVVDSVVTRYVFEGDANKIASGDWVVGRFTDGLRALKIRTIDEHTADDKTKTFSISFSNLVGNEGELQRVYADFRGELIAEGASVNTAEIDSEEIELADLPDSLKAGNTVMLTAEGEKPVAVKIESIDGNTIKTNPPATGFTKGNLIIRGNVALAGHGESKPVKILGSGDASKSSQEFTLKVEDVSFTPDATKSSGVAAAIEVEVAGRVWDQVSTLKDSAPGDHHYAIRMTEEGYVKILFGEGEHGRRLPSGKNNIRVRYRVGSGIAGNVPAGSLEKPVNPHPLVETVQQPMQAAGGGDMESITSLRENAPPTLLALERAVSLSDFSHLAASQSSVWQAKAYSQILHGGRTESVRVVIVPAGGVYSPEIKEAIRSLLQKHALPGVQVTVDPCNKKRFSLSITVRVRTDEFVAEAVEKSVASAVLDHFALQNRKLGAHLYLSEVYKIVEGVQGVENSICVLNGDASLQVIEADDESTVVYMDTVAPEKPSTLEVRHEEYRP